MLTVRYPPHPAVAKAVALSTNIAIIFPRATWSVGGQLILALRASGQCQYRALVAYSKKYYLHLVSTPGSCKDSCFHDHAEGSSSSSAKSPEKVWELGSVDGPQRAIGGDYFELKLKDFFCRIEKLV